MCDLFLFVLLIFKYIYCQYLSNLHLPDTCGLYSHTSKSKSNILKPYIYFYASMRFEYLFYFLFLQHWLILNYSFKGKNINPVAVASVQDKVEVEPSLPLRFKGD